MLFRMLSRAGGVCYQLLMVRHSTYPFKTFRILIDDRIADEIAQEPECCLDLWTLSFRRAYPTAELLQSAAAKTRLAALAALVEVDTVSTERAHARTRRRVKGRVQTCPMDFSEVSAFQGISNVGPQYRPRKPAKQPRSQRRRKSRGSVPARVVLPCDASETAAGQPRMRSATQANKRFGAWREFVARSASDAARSSGSRWDAAHMRTLSSAYHALSPMELQRLAEQAKLRKVAHQWGSVQSSQKSRSQQAQRKEVALLRERQASLSGQLQLVPNGAPNASLVSAPSPAGNLMNLLPKMHRELRDELRAARDEASSCVHLCRVIACCRVVVAYICLWTCLRCRYFQQY